MCGKKEIAEDLYQETWIKLAVHAPRLRADTDLGGWLYTVARNLARSELRATTSRPRAVEVSSELASGAASPYEWASANETQGHLEQALLDLPLPLREVLLLVIVEDVDHERAAAILNLTPAALRQRLSRARATLTERLEARTRADRSQKD